MTETLFPIASPPDEMRRTAVISDDDVYRYLLTRAWGEADGRHVTWVMLNPSTADGQLDDPTARRCAGFTRLWGFRQFEIVNLHAYRATKPENMPRDLSIAVGPENDGYVLRSCATADLVVAAWGTKASKPRVRWAKEHLPASTIALAHTRDGFPQHPLFALYDTKPVLWRRT